MNEERTAQFWEILGKIINTMTLTFTKDLAAGGLPAAKLAFEIRLKKHRIDVMEQAANDANAAFTEDLWDAAAEIVALMVAYGVWSDDVQ